MLVRNLLPLAAILLVGCGSSDPTPYEYRADCLHFRSEVELDESALLRDVQLARLVLDEGGLVPADAFCPAFSEVGFTVVAERWVINGEITSGQTSPTGIKLHASMGVLAHELLHFWDLWHWVSNPDHVGWGGNGYFAASALYHVSAEPVEPSGT